jgi:predicted transport protein
MPIYKRVNGKFKKLKSAPLDKEKTLQKVIEDNLQEMLDMYFLETEYPTTFGGRIDTLAVDYSGTPVIIEYKLNKNEQVINQALSYLKWLKAQKVDFFEMLVQKKLGPEVARTLTIDWKNPRVICIAESYNKFDIDTVEVVPLRIELLLYRYYENEIFFLEALTVSDNKKATPPTPEVISADEASVGALLAKANTKTAKLFQELRQRIFSFDESIKEKATLYYVAYRVTKNFAEVYIQKNQIRLLLRPVEYNDPRNLIKQIPDSYNWTLNRSVYLTSLEDLEYVLGLVEQSYKDIL